MKPLGRFFLFVLVCAGVAIVLSPWVYQGIQWGGREWGVHSSEGWWGSLWKELSRHPFHRVFNRVFQISVLLGIWPLLKQSGYTHLRAFRLISRRGWLDVLQGLGWSLLFLAGYVLILMAVGVYQLSPSTSVDGWMWARIFMTASVVSVFEELFFRSYLYQISRQSVGDRLALLLNMVFFATIHYFKPKSPDVMKQVDWSSGLELFARAWERFTHPADLIGGLMVLMVIAWILCKSMDWTGSIYLAMGLHAGWILAQQGVGGVFQIHSTAPVWVFGGGDIAQGAAAVIPLCLQAWLMKKWKDRPLSI